LHVLISLVNLGQHSKIVRDFHVCLSSICKYSSITVTLHIVTDSRSQEKADRVVGKLKKELCKDKVHVEYHDIGFIARELEPLMDVFKVGVTFTTPFLQLTLEVSGGAYTIMLYTCKLK
jgi:hypothetical protein